MAYSWQPTKTHLNDDPHENFGAEKREIPRKSSNVGNCFSQLGVPIFFCCWHAISTFQMKHVELWPKLVWLGSLRSFKIVLPNSWAGRIQCSVPTRLAGKQTLVQVFQRISNLQVVFYGLDPVMIGCEHKFCEKLSEERDLKYTFNKVVYVFNVYTIEVTN